MKPLRNLRRTVLLLAAAVLLLGVPAATAATASAATTAAASTASPGTGWIRLAHLAPGTPPVDVYLYSFGDSAARVVLHHVSYGSVSAYQTVPAGDYSVAMRPAGDAASSPPVLSASTWVRAGRAYTAVALGPSSGPRLQVVSDQLTTPAGRALVRVIQASLKQPRVTVSWNGKVIAGSLPFASVTSYQAVPPGTQRVAVAGDTGARDTDTRDTAVTLTEGSIHTLVVLDGAQGLEIGNLVDAAGSSQLPKGGAATGFGGTAPRGPGSPLPWLEVIAAGSALAAGGGLGLYRSRRGRAPHPRRARRQRPARA
jgi:hypothetical protein